MFTFQFLIDKIYSYTEKKNWHFQSISSFKIWKVNISLSQFSLGFWGNERKFLNIFRALQDAIIFQFQEMALVENCHAYKFKKKFYFCLPLRFSCSSYGSGPGYTRNVKVTMRKSGIWLVLCSSQFCYCLHTKHYSCLSLVIVNSHPSFIDTLLSDYFF